LACEQWFFRKIRFFFFTPCTNTKYKSCKDGMSRRFVRNHYNGFGNVTDNTPDNLFYSVIRCSDSAETMINLCKMDTVVLSRKKLSPFS